MTRFLPPLFPFHQHYILSLSQISVGVSLIQEPAWRSSNCNPFSRGSDLYGPRRCLC